MPSILSVAMRMGGGRGVDEAGCANVPMIPVGGRQPQPDDCPGPQHNLRMLAPETIDERATVCGQALADACKQQAATAGTAASCIARYETLKQRKFGSNFNAMLAWWRLNKEAEYRVLEARVPTPDARSAALRQR